MEQLSINLTIGDTALKLKSPPGDEHHLRQATVMVIERMKQHKAMHDIDDQEALCRIAIEGVVAYLKGIEQAERSSQMIVERIQRLEQMIII